MRERGFPYSRAHVPPETPYPHSLSAVCFPTGWPFVLLNPTVNSLGFLPALVLPSQACLLLG